jgi:predicted ribonuclease YlaK
MIYAIRQLTGRRKDRSRWCDPGTVNRDVTDKASKLFFLDRNDNLIIGTALYFKEKYPGSQVTLVSKDVKRTHQSRLCGYQS